MCRDSRPVRRMLLVLSALTYAGFGCQSSDRGDDKLLVYVSIPPQAFLVERVCGDLAECRVLLPPGAAPEHLDLRPSQLRDLRQAAVYVRIGVPFEAAAWEKIRGVNPEMRIVDGLQGIEMRSMETDSHAHAFEDPHVWLDPGNALKQGEAIAAAMAEVDPERAGDYTANLERLRLELEQLDHKIKAILEPVRGGTFWVYHPAWGYFADAYGLSQQAIELDGKEPGAQTLTLLTDRAKSSRVRTIFVEPQHSQAQAVALALEIGAEVKVLDPQAKNYIENLEAVARAIAEALS